MLAARSDREAGFTLAEMLVSIIVFTLVVGSITGIIVANLQKQYSTSARGSALAQDRNALEQVDRDIRSANPLCYATGTEITMLETNVTTNLNTIADYTVSGSKLVYTEYSTTATAPANPIVACTLTSIQGGVATTSTLYENAVLVSRTILASLVTGSTAVFTTPATGTFDTCPTTTGTAPNATTVAAASSIRTLTVSISTQPLSLKAPVSTSDCGTDLRNYSVTTTT